MIQIYRYTLIALLAVNHAYGQVFWSEDFSEENLPSGWTTEDANPDDNSNVVWEICTTPGDCTPANLTNLPFQSESSNNGYALVDSDAGGDDYDGKHISRLTTPAINCSGRNKVFLEFHSFIITFTNNPAENALLKIWTATDTLILKPYPRLFKDDSNEASRNPEILNFDISEIAANQESVFIQWEWTGKFELFWCLDDVKLSESDIMRPARAVWFDRFNNNGQGWETTSNIDSALWVWDPFGDLSNSVLYFNSDPIQSSTAQDGVMIFPADYYTFEGEQLPPPYPFYVAELISPVIDLSEVAFPVALVFTQLVNTINPAPDAPVNADDQKLITSFQVSLDGGQSWGNPYDANETLGQQEMRYSTERFELEGLEGQSNVKIKFTFAGDVFFWALDDIALVERAPYDIKINSNFYAIMPNALTPLSQVAEEFFVADIMNVGIQPASDVALELVIKKKSTNEIIYQDTNFFGTLQPGFLAENEIFTQPFNPDAIQETGSYEGIYTAIMDSLDYVPENNVIFWNFEITDSTFAKETGRTGNITAAADFSFTYGNFFFVPDGQGYKATSVSFGVFNTQQLENRTVNTYLYKWTGDANNDGFIQENERLGPLGFNSYTFEGNEGRSLINIPMNLDNEAVPLEDSSYYIVVVEYSTNDTQRLFFNTSEEYNYQATWGVGDSLGRPRFASVVDVGNTGTFNPAGFGLDVVPQIRLHIQPLTISTMEPVFEEANIVVSPNPTRNMVRLNCDLKEKAEELQVLIRDSSGKIVIARKFRNFQQKELTFDARKWPSGLYFLELLTGSDQYHKKIIIQN